MAAVVPKAILQVTVLSPQGKYIKTLFQVNEFTFRGSNSFTFATFLGSAALREVFQSIMRCLPERGRKKKKT